MTPPSIIWVGNPFFQSALAELGWRVHWRNPPAEAILGWDDLVEEAGFTPDIVIVGDKSLPPFVVGMEDFPCLTVFYAVDSHIHSWFPFYAQGFDICLVSLKDHLPLFTGMRLSRDTVWWSPPYAKPDDVPRPPDPEKPLRDILFVGTVDPDVNPDRAAFMRELAALEPRLHVTRGTYRELYPQAKIVLNHTAANDLNFRVFEALGCGACLVTPVVRHGFEDFFTNGRELFTYNQQDVKSAAALLKALLTAPARRAKAAAAGHAAVLAGHYMRHRAEAFASRIEHLRETGKAGETVAARLRESAAIRASWLRLLYLHHAETANDPVREARYLAASKGLKGSP